MSTRNLDIITIGSGTRDVFLKSARFKVVRDDRFSTGEAECMALGTKIDIPDITFETGGGATNSAVSFARFGYHTGIITRIGKSDSHSQDVLNTLKREGVDTSTIIRDAKHQTGYSTLLLTSAGERTILAHRGASAHFTTSDIPWSKLQSKWLYITSLAGNMSLLGRLLNHANKKGIKVACNPGTSELSHPAKKLFPLLRKLDIFFLNDLEAAALTGMPHTDEVGMLKKLGRALPGIVVITAGKDGSFSCDNEYRFHSTNRPIRVLDTTGAGDAFGAGFVAAYMKREDIPYALKVGTLNAESVIQHIGAKPGLLRRFPSVEKIRVDKYRFPN
ncbi:MAG: carbohydrate kinase family protein [Candidatus Nomurabacteria bacterium]|nr:MAG: carbohydrate kinase family protein [Candidatus Nomurabacteria bacterium]